MADAHLPRDMESMWTPPQNSTGGQGRDKSWRFFDIVQKRTLFHITSRTRIFHWRITIWVKRHAWVSIIKAAARYTARFSVSSRRWKFSQSFIILSLIQVAEKHVGRIPKFCCLLLEPFINQLPKGASFTVTAESIIVCRNFLGSKTKVWPVRSVQCLKESSIPFDSTVPLGLSEWILATHLKLSWMTRLSFFWTLQWSNYTFLETSNKVNGGWGRTCFWILFFQLLRAANRGLTTVVVVLHKRLHHCKVNFLDFRNEGETFHILHCCLHQR